MATFSNELVRGTVKTLVLKVLDDQSRMYGYQLIKEVKRRTEDKIILTEGALYPLLHQLEKDQLVTTEKEKIANRTRKYYLLTGEGKQTAKAKTIELLEFMQTIAGFIKADTSNT